MAARRYVTAGRPSERAQKKDRLQQPYVRTQLAIATIASLVKKKMPASAKKMIVKNPDKKSRKKVERFAPKIMNTCTQTVQASRTYIHS